MDEHEGSTTVIGADGSWTHVSRLSDEALRIDQAFRDAERLTRSFTATVSDDDGDGVWVAFDSFSHVYGEGRNPTHALFDWLRSLDAHYRDLKRQKLAPGMMQELTAIERVLGK